MCLEMTPIKDEIKNKTLSIKVKIIEFEVKKQILQRKTIQDDFCFFIRITIRDALYYKPSNLTGYMSLFAELN